MKNRDMFYQNQMEGFIMNPGMYPNMIPYNQNMYQNNFNIDEINSKFTNIENSIRNLDMRISKLESEKNAVVDNIYMI